MSEKLCKLCGKRHYAKGLCQKCYIDSRKKRPSDPKPSLEPASVKSEIAASAEKSVCAAWLCEEEVYGMGVCKKHYEEWSMEKIALSDENKKQRKNRKQNAADPV